ncbi:hypothetical protein [Streptococcus rupicaprae]|uniref:hypothetical protein n=1 Tax=Streptococcus rupicaprae TaxID=759619 RepID=UPI00339B2587
MVLRLAFQKLNYKQMLSLIVLISATKIVLYSLVTLLLIGWDFSLIIVFLVSSLNLISDTLVSFGGAMTSPISM